MIDSKYEVVSENSGLNIDLFLMS